MSKPGLLLAGACALAAFSAVASTASALTERYCDGNPYDNTPLIHDFSVDTPGSYREHDESEVLVAALACGTKIGYQCAGAETYYDHTTIGLPPGVEVADTTGQDGQQVGITESDYLYHRAGDCQPVSFPYDHSEPSADSKSVCESENENLVGGPVAGEVVACYRSEPTLGRGWIWVTRDTDGRQWMTVGPLHPTSDYDAGMTKLRLRLCTYFFFGYDCPQFASGEFIQKNGDASILGCAGGRGLYTVTATRRDGIVTPPVSHCVEWSATKVQRSGQSG